MLSSLIFFNLKDHYSLIQVSGDDANSFLQGQLTNDINLASENKLILSGFCNPKGRLLAIFQIAKINNIFYLICPKTIAETVCKKLSMYILRSKVKIDINPETFALHGFIISSQQLLTDFFKNFPNTNFAAQQDNMNLLIKLPGYPERYMVICSGQTSSDMMIKFKENSGKIDEWKLHDIEAGIPSIYPNTQEVFIPQSLNLDLLQAVNFKKGCYTGQEIIARTHYLGKVKRRMYRAAIKLSSLINIGDDLYVNDLIVGKVIDFAKEKNSFKCLIELIVEEKDKQLTLNGSNVSISGLAQENPN